MAGFGKEGVVTSGAKAAAAAAAAVLGIEMRMETEMPPQQQRRRIQELEEGAGQVRCGSFQTLRRLGGSAAAVADSRHRAVTAVAVVAAVAATWTMMVPRQGAERRCGS